MITELEYANEQIALAEALIRLRFLQALFERQYGEGSYERAVAAVQHSLFPTGSLPPESN